MPIPTESMGACIRHLRRKNPGMSSDQRVAICLDVMRKAGKEVAPKKSKK